MLGSSDHFVHRRLAARNHDVGRRFTILVWQRKPVASRRDVREMRGLPAVRDGADFAILYQRQTLSRHPLAIERRPRLAGMVDIIVDRDVASKEPGSHAVIQG